MRDATDNHREIYHFYKWKVEKVDIYDIYNQEDIQPLHRMWKDVETMWKRVNPVELIVIKKDEDPNWFTRENVFVGPRRYWR